MQMIRFQGRNFIELFRELKKGKASEIYEIPSEILKLGGEELHNRLYELILHIHGAGVIPEDFEKNIIYVYVICCYELLCPVIANNFMETKFAVHIPLLFYCSLMLVHFVIILATSGNQ